MPRPYKLPVRLVLVQTNRVGAGAGYIGMVGRLLIYLSVVSPQEEAKQKAAGGSGGRTSEHGLGCRSNRASARHRGCGGGACACQQLAPR
eukprot:38464-Eustigmatos_ZCMA.PRE.1